MNRDEIRQKPCSLWQEVHYFQAIFLMLSAVGWLTYFVTLYLTYQLSINQRTIFHHTIDLMLQNYSRNFSFKLVQWDKSLQI